MYKATYDSHDYINRVGSHSTKPSRNGHVEVLPPEAREAELKYQEYTQQIATLKEELEQNQSRLKVLNKRLASTVPFSDYAKLESRRAATRARVTELHDTLKRLSIEAKAVGKESFYLVYHSIAQARLNEETHRSIASEATRLLAREVDQNPGIKTVSKTKIANISKRYKVEPVDLVAWISQQESRFNEIKAHTTATGRKVDPAFDHQMQCCLALKALVTRFMQEDSRLAE